MHIALITLLNWLPLTEKGLRTAPVSLVTPSGEILSGTIDFWRSSPCSGLHTKSSFTDCGSMFASTWIYVPKAWGSTVLAKREVKKTLSIPAFSARWVKWINLSCSTVYFPSVSDVYVPGEPFLVVFDISGQFQFKLSFCLSSCISGNASVVLNGWFVLVCLANRWFVLV